MTPRVRHRRQRWLVALACIGLFAGDGALAAPGATDTGAEADPLLQALVAVVRGDEAPDRGVRISRVQRSPREIVFVYRDDVDDPIGRLRLRPRGRHHRDAGSFSVQISMKQGRPRYHVSDAGPRDAAAFAAIVAATARIAEHDDGAFQQLFPENSSRGPSWWFRFQSQIVGAFALVALALALIRLRRGPLTSSWDFKAVHIVPSLLQIIIFAYWAAYVTATEARLPQIALQLAFAFAIDACLWLAKTGNWRFSLAPVPIVLSTNLFVWYNPAWLQFSVIALALGSKALLQFRGHHVFNPSAFGISVAALLTTFAPSVFGWGTPTTGIPLNLAPNMAEVMLLVAVVAQLRFPIVLATLGAIVGLSTASALGPPSPMWPATLLILLLFSTDPGTIPRTNPGRLLYGIFLGIGIACLAFLYRQASLPDDYSKVLAILLVNVASPALDRLGAFLMRWWQRALELPSRTLLRVTLLLAVGLAVLRASALYAVVPLLLFAELGFRRWHWPGGRELVRSFLEPRWNRVHVITWLALATALLAQSKPRLFEAYGHWRYQTPGVVLDEAGVPTRELNPMFTRIFTFPDELRRLRGQD